MIRSLLLAGGCGVLAAIPWFVPQLFSLTWVAFIAWIGITPAQPRVAFRLWLFGGITFLATALYWLPEAAALRLNMSYGKGLLAAAPIVCWDALRFGVFGYVMTCLGRRRAPALVWPVVWVALEFVWPQVFPWRIGQTQLGWLSLCQIAECTGVYGISFLLIGTSAAIGLWLRERRGWLSPTIAGLSMIGVAAWGCWRMADIEQSANDAPHLQIGLVQSGAPSDDMATELQSRSREIAQDVDLVAWGEGTIGEVALSQTDMAPPENATGLGCPLLCGGTSYSSETSGPCRRRNTAYLVGRDQAIEGRYHKRVLMPWGEYAVGQEWLPCLRRLLRDDIGEIVPGTSPEPLTLPGHGRLGVLICYEDLSAEAARQTVREGGQVLLNINNLASFGDTPAAALHQRLAIFRAIENRRWLARCGTVGSTALITATGRVQCQAPLHERALLTASIPLLERKTIYTQHGDLFAWGCVALAALWSLSAGRVVNRSNLVAMATGLVLIRAACAISQFRFAHSYIAALRTPSKFK